MLRSLNLLSATRATFRATSVPKHFPATCAKTFFLVRAGRPTRLLSSTAVRREAGTNSALSAALQEELKYEEETDGKASNPPDFLQEFQRKGIWKIQESPGKDEAVLTRSYGNEKIRLEFSVLDLMSPTDETEFDDFNMRSKGEEGAAETEDESNDTPPPPIRVNIAINKRGVEGALAIEATVQDGSFLIDGASYFAEGGLAFDSSAEGDWKRRTLYLGPQYDRLELGVQEKFDEYLKEREIDDDLALFIPEYAEWKEQKEYISWLGHVKRFVDA